MILENEPDYSQLLYDLSETVYLDSEVLEPSECAIGSIKEVITQFLADRNLKIVNKDSLNDT